MKENKKISSILDFWEAVEFLSPQTIPRLAPHDLLDPFF